MADPIQQRRLKHEVFNQSLRNSKIIVWLVKTPLRFKNCGWRKIAFLQPRVANRGNGCIEVMVEIVKRMESKNVPPGNFRSADHPQPDGVKRIDFIEPTHGQTLGRHEVIERGNHDRRRPGRSDAIAESMQTPKCGCLPLKPFAGGHWHGVSPRLPSLIRFVAVDEHKLHTPSSNSQSTLKVDGKWRVL